MTIFTITILNPFSKMSMNRFQSVFVTLLILVCNRSYPCLIFIYGYISKRTLKKQNQLKTALQIILNKLTKTFWERLVRIFETGIKIVFSKVVNILDGQLTALEYKTAYFYHYLYISKMCLNPIITVYGLFTNHLFSVPSQYIEFFFKLSAWIFQWTAVLVYQ